VLVSPTGLKVRSHRPSTSLNHRLHHPSLAPSATRHPQVAWAFPPATVFTSFDLRRSGDPTFPAATTVTFSALPAVNFTSASDPAGVYGNFDALVARFGATGQLYYAVRGTTASGQTTAWSAPFAAFNATVAGTLFATPGGATGAQCGSFIAPCGAIQDGLDAASTGSTLLLLPGTYSGPRNRGLTMSGKVRVARGWMGGMSQRWPLTRCHRLPSHRASACWAWLAARAPPSTAASPTGASPSPAARASRRGRLCRGSQSRGASRTQAPAWSSPAPAQPCLTSPSPNARPTAPAPRWRA
jgi:hypothetical protein